MIVYLVAAADGHYDLEPAPANAAECRPATGFWGRRLDRLHARWTRIVADAQERAPAGMWARWRALLVCHIDESIEEQRSLWALRDRAAATLVHPAELSGDQAAQALRALLARARRHHGWWLIVDTILFGASGVLMVLPGPNLIAYYFAFRVVGHYLSWRGARQALDAVSWTFEPLS